MTLKLLHQLIAYEVIGQVLAGHLSLDYFKQYLQKQRQSWAGDILTIVDSIPEAVTFEQLQTLFLEEKVPEKDSLWERLKNQWGSIIRIRKINKAEEQTNAMKQNIHKAVMEKDIHKALKYFQEFSPQQQALFSDWAQKAQNRLILENARQKLLFQMLDQ